MLSHRCSRLRLSFDRALWHFLNTPDDPGGISQKHRLHKRLYSYRYVLVHLVTVMKRRCWIRSAALLRKLEALCNDCGLYEGFFRKAENGRVIFVVGGSD